MSSESKINPGKNEVSAQNHNNSSIETQFSEHVLLQRKGRAQTLASNVKDLFALRRVKIAGEASSDHLLHGVAHFEEHHSRSQIFSLAVHGGLGLVIFLAIALQMPTRLKPLTNPPYVFAPDPAELRKLTLPQIYDADQGRGSGGERNPIPASAGQLPPSSMRDQIAMPSVIRNPIARLQETPTLIGPEQFLKIIPDVGWGDPNAKLVTDSNGPGKGPGMGTRDGSGIGNRPGPGAGDSDVDGVSRRIYRDGEGMRSPECSYCPRPDYSDEARKAKYQGSVVLSVVVLPDGKASRIEVLTSPGMGLDEKAIEAVRNWRFKPGLGPNGKPASIAVTIEVVFQLF